LSLESVSSPNNSFDIPRIVGIIPQSRPNLANSIVNALFGIEVKIISPKPVLNLFPSEEIAGSLQQKDENFQGLFFELYNSASPPKLVPPEIEFALIENEEFRHSNTPLCWWRVYTSLAIS
jgi:hypothetical protein